MTRPSVWQSSPPATPSTVQAPVPFQPREGVVTRLFLAPTSAALAEAARKVAQRPPPHTSSMESRQARLEALDRMMARLRSRCAQRGLSTV